MVTAIVAGGWTSIVPFMLHLLVLNDVPMALWVMVLPGVYLGARVAPLVHGVVGLQNVLVAFATFLVATSVLMIWTS